MEIKINDQILDVSLDNEKTLGEVLSAMEQWLSNSGHVLSGLRIDGIDVKASQIEEAFTREIDSVKCLEIETNTAAELTVSSLVRLLEDIKEYENLNFEDKTKFFENWKESVCGRLLSSEIADIYELCVRTFSQGDVTTQNLSLIAEERLREVTDPLKECEKIEPVLNEICEKLVDLPLDIQTGKDMKAAQTIQLFTALTEKIFRVFYQIDIQGYTSDKPENIKEQIIRQITEFTDVLKELLDAYEKNDSVLVGDLAEYEASVRIKELYKVIMENCRGKNG